MIRHNEKRGAIGVAVKIRPLRLALQLGDRLGEILITPQQARDMGGILITLAAYQEHDQAGTGVADIADQGDLMTLRGVTPN